MQHTCNSYVLYASPNTLILFHHLKSILSSANHVASHRSNSNRPPLSPLPHPSQGQNKELFFGIILHFLYI